MDPAQVAQQIRFALFQLRADNAHHVFEDICRRLAAQRIASNIIPATGPVSAYGDQGRDFETFRTYIQTAGLSGSCFIGLASQRRIAFVCTLQQENLEAKILQDIRKVAEGALRVDAVDVFTEANIGVGLRHRMQKTIKEELDLEVDFFDGKAIAEQLSAPDVFWIAVRYLQLPAEIAPENGTDDQGWYGEARERWRSTDRCRGSFGEYYEVRQGLRSATFDSERREDLTFWISTAEKLLPTLPPELGRRMDYEILVAQLRGLGTLSGSEHRIRSYFAEVDKLQYATDLTDAQVLLTYIVGAIDRGLADIDSSEVADWRDALAERADAMLSTAGRDAAVQILETKAALCLLSGWEADGVRSLTADELDSALRNWIEAAEAAAEAPLYPVEPLADVAALLAPLLVDRPMYGQLTQLLDDIVSERSGRSKAAEKCRDRAMQLFRAGRLISALRELHEARIDWLTGDTLRGSLLAMGICAHCYNLLGLHMAAKYYWLALAHVAVHSGEHGVLDLVPIAVLSAARSDYDLGALIGFSKLAEKGLGYHDFLD